MSRLIVCVFTFICVFGFVVDANAQGPVRKLTRELQLQRADYPGPITYAPSDQDTRSKRLRMQTGHYGLFYNCDDEECKRLSPYICWNSQHTADWYCGWKNAWRRDRNDIIQRLFDGSCQDCEGNASAGPSIQTAPAYYGSNTPARQRLTPSRRESQAQYHQPAQVQRVAGQRLPVINAPSLGRTQAENSEAVAPQRQAERRGIFQRR